MLQSLLQVVLEWVKRVSKHLLKGYLDHYRAKKSVNLKRYLNSCLKDCFMLKDTSKAGKNELERGMERRRKLNEAH